MKVHQMRFAFLGSIALGLGSCTDEKHNCPVRTSNTVQKEVEYVNVTETVEKVVNTNTVETQIQNVVTNPVASGGGIDSATAGSLTLQLTPPQVGLRPSLNESGGLNLLGGTEQDNHRELKFTWDPSQVPLKSMNKILCILSETSYQSFVGAGNFIAKIKVEDCFKRGEGGGAAAGDQQQGSQSSKLEDVVVNAARGDDGVTLVRMWFAREIATSSGTNNGTTQHGTVGTAGTTSSDPLMWMFKPDGNDPNIKSKLNFYVTVEVVNSIEVVPPYGEFRMTYQMIPEYNATEDNAKGGIKGFLDVFKDPNTGELDIKYNERTTSVETWSDFANTYSATNRQEQKAFASLKLDEAEKVSSGLAITATQWSRTSNGSANYQGQYADKSGQYFMAFDRANGSSNSSANIKGRAVIDWDAGGSGGWWNSASGFNPQDPRCEEIGTEIPTTFSYVPYNNAGDPIVHMTSLMLEKPGEMGAGCWISGEWGSSCWGAIADGDLLVGKPVNGEPISFTANLLPGTLRESMNYKDVTLQISSDLTLLCTGGCPKPNFDATELQNQWNYSSSMYLTADAMNPVTYTFDASARRLKHNGQVIRLPADAQWGWLNISLKDGADKMYNYEMSAYSKPVVVYKQGESQPFVPPKPMKFRNEAFDIAKFARPNSMLAPDMNNLHDVRDSYWMNYGGMHNEGLRLDGNQINVGWFQPKKVYDANLSAGGPSNHFEFTVNDIKGLSGIVVGEPLQLLSNAGALPDPLDAAITYYVVDVEFLSSGGINTGAKFKIASVAGGTPIASTSGGGGAVQITLVNRKVLIDQWGNVAWAPKITFKPGAVLYLDGDPDGAGPRYDNEPITLMPLVTQEQSIVRRGADDDCSTALANSIAEAKELLSAPNALTNNKFDSRLMKQSRPAGAIPVRALNGTAIVEKKD